MPIPVRCPKCESRFAVPRIPGPRGSLCPACLSVVAPTPVDPNKPPPVKKTYAVTKPAPPAAAANNSAEKPGGANGKATQPRPQHPRAGPKGGELGEQTPKGPEAMQLHLTHLGLGFHYVKVIVSLLGLLLWLAHTMLAAIDDGIVSHLAGGLYLFVTAIALLLGITGSAFCCQVPRGSRARTLILVSLVADALGALFFFVAIVAALGDALGLGGRNLSYVEQGCEFLSTIVSVFGLILFLLFLKQLAYYLDENIMGDQATDPIAYAAALIGGTIVGDILVRFLFKLGTNAPLLGTAFLLVALLAFFYFAGKLLMMSLNTIGPIRNALEKRLAPSARSWRQEIPRWAWLGVTGATLALLGSLLLLVGIAAWRNTASASPAQPSPAPKQDGPLAGKGPDDSPADLLPPKVPPPATDFEGLLAYWPFEDGKPGESVADLSPNRINGRAVGGSSVEGIRGKALHLSNPYCFDYTADHRLNFPAVSRLHPRLLGQDRFGERHAPLAAKQSGGRGRHRRAARWRPSSSSSSSG